MKKALFIVVWGFAGCQNPDPQCTVANEQDKTVQGDPDREVQLAADQFVRAWKASNLNGTLSLSSFDDGGYAYASPSETMQHLANHISRLGLEAPVGDPTAEFQINCAIHILPMTEWRKLLSFEFVVNNAKTGRLAFKHVAEVVRKPVPTVDRGPVK